jgi:hypothetical protein
MAISIRKEKAKRGKGKTNIDCPLLLLSQISLQGLDIVFKGVCHGLPGKTSKRTNAQKIVKAVRARSILFEMY